MDVDRPWITVVTVAPRSVKELAPGPGASRVAGQDGEQIEFLGPQMDEPAVPAQLVREEIELAARSDREGPAGAGARPLVEQARRAASSPGSIELGTASSKPSRRASRRASTASGAETWTTRNPCRRRRSRATSSVSAGPPGGVPSRAMRGRACSRRVTNDGTSGTTRTGVPAASPGSSRAGPSTASASQPDEIDRPAATWSSMDAASGGDDNRMLGGR